MFKDIIATIKPLDATAMDKCQVRLDNLTKPLNSLNAFEHIARQIAGITKNPKPNTLKKSIVLITDSQQDSMRRVANISCGNTAINSFAEHVSAKIVLADIKESIQQTATCREQAMQAIEYGIKLAQQEILRGCQVIGLGQIGNRINFFDLAITDDPIEVLTKVELQIAGLVGVIIGAAAGRGAIVLDDLNTTIAALIAVKMTPKVRDYLIGSHLSAEAEHKAALQQLGIASYLKLDLDIGEGVGAALGMSLINASLHVLNDMKTFGEAQVAVAQDGPGALKQNKDVR